MEKEIEEVAQIGSQKNQGSVGEKGVFGEFFNELFHCAQYTINV